MVSLKPSKILQAVNESLREICPLYTATELGCCSDDSLIFVKALLDPIKEVMCDLQWIRVKTSFWMFYYSKSKVLSIQLILRLDLNFQQIIDYKVWIVWLVWNVTWLQATSCEVCAENIAAVICSLTCSPDQSVSLKILVEEEDWFCKQAKSLR